MATIGAIYTVSLRLPRKELLCTCSTELLRQLTSTKIGFVNNASEIEKRMSNLGTSTPFELHRYRLTHCEHPRLLEKYWHTTHKDKWVRGEWYDIDKVDIDTIHKTSQHYHEHGVFLGDVDLLNVLRSVAESSTRKQSGPKTRDDDQPVVLSKRGLFRHVQMILHNHIDRIENSKVRMDGRSYLNATEFEVVSAVLLLHKYAEEKVGMGVKAIFVAKHAEYTQDSYCFHVKRQDGSEEDFSYRYALGLRR